MDKIYKQLTIWAVCKDSGGTAGILPVVDALMMASHTVRLFADGKAIDLLPRLGRDFFACTSVDDVLSRYPNERPNLFLTSMCSGGGVGRDLVPHLRGVCPIVALQDTYGARLLTDWSEFRFRPDFICVNDEVGAHIVHEAWPDMPANRIKITGYPALDRYSGYNAADVAIKTRQTLQLESGKAIVVYFGQVARTGEVLQEVVVALNELRQDLYFIPRQHGRMVTDAPEQMSYWQAALADFKGGTLIKDTSAVETASLLASADVVLAMYSTVLTEAAVLRKQSIAVLYPDVGMQQFLTETGGVMTEFPLVRLGCTVKVSLRQELTDALIAALGRGLGLEANQSRYFLADGKNAQRVVESLIYAANNRF